MFTRMSRELDTQERFFNSLPGRPEMDLTRGNGYTPAEQQEYLMASSLNFCGQEDAFQETTFEALERGLAETGRRLSAAGPLT